MSITAFTVTSSPRRATVRGTVHVYRWYKAGTTANPAADYLYTTGSEDYTGQGYAFQGVAFDAFKYPDPSYVTITTAPNGGETLTGGSTATVTWNANTTMDKVNLYYSLDSGSTWSFIATAPNTGNTGSYSWKVPFVSSTHCRVMVQYVLLDDKSQKVDACYGYSNSDFKITSTGIVIKPTIMLNISVLPAPCLLHADSDGKAVYLGWTNWSLTDTGYKVERTTGAAATSVQWETIATLPSHSSFYSDTAVTAGTTYIYRVKATGGLFDSAYSNEATIKPVVLSDPDRQRNNPHLHPRHPDVYRQRHTGHDGRGPGCGERPGYAPGALHLRPDRRRSRLVPAGPVGDDYKSRDNLEALSWQQYGVPERRTAPD